MHLIALALVALSLLSTRKPRRDVPVIKPSIVVVSAQDKTDWFPQADGLRSIYFH
jgi:hypothetical protein